VGESSALYDLGYLLAAGLFIFGLKYLGSPRTAPRGNQLGSLGMLIAVVVTLLRMGAESGGLVGWPLLLGGLALGGLIGAVMATRVEMTGMPEMVGLFNGFGGAASALVGLAELLSFDASASDPSSLGQIVFIVAVGASSLIGWVTLTGSLVAVLKLSGKLRKNVNFPGQNLVKGLLLATVVVAVALLLQDPGDRLLLGGLVAISCVLGVLMVIPIGGGDMPVVVSFLNSLSGLAAAATGFVVNNNALIIGGSLVGAAGLILTGIMCKAMNRSLKSVLFKSYGGGAGGAAGGGSGEKRSVQGYEAEEAAMSFDGVRRVIIVPGYGMAVSQAQHTVRELGEMLQSMGVEVSYAIHPVAGRMPGHMNVLLAEANVPYEQLFDLDEINSSFGECDVALVVGANDTINPAAHTDEGGPLWGMPVLDVEKAGTVMIVKRSLSPGYAGVDNDLFYRPTTMMLFGDGKQMLSELLAALKDL
jgi:NAD(P) transhydrogenase subunit beta